MPAQSPTLSPTLSAITAGLRGSSSGMPASTLPTRSAPTSAPLVKMPPPRRAKIEISEPPKARPTSACSDVVGVAAGDVEHHAVVARHAEQAEADHQHAGDGAAAERDLQRRVEADAGRLRGAHVGAHRHVHADVAGERRRGSRRRAKPPAVPQLSAKPRTRNSTTPTMAMVRVLAVQVGLAPSWMAAAISCMRALPAGCARIQRADEHAVKDREHAGADREPQREVSGHEQALPNEVVLVRADGRAGLCDSTCPAAQKRRGTIPQRPFSAASAPARSSAPRTAAARPCTAGSPRP